MICSKCGAVVQGGPFCGTCGSAVGTPVPANGMATLRIIARKYLPVWMRVIMPIPHLFRGYKVYISVDDQNYVLNSKKQQIDISVVPGTHQIRISSISKGQANLIRIGGDAFSFGSAVTGNANGYVTGKLVADLGAALSKTGTAHSFQPGDLLEFRVKMNFMSQIVEDCG